MKYFTPELYARGNSADEAVVPGIEEAWERALQRYERRRQKLMTTLPEAVRRFEEASVCLHDAEVLHLARQGDQFVLILQPEQPSQNLVILHFTLCEDPVIVTETFPSTLCTPHAVWLYEEFDVDRRGRYTFDVLLSNGWEIKLRFRDFRFLIGEQILQARNGEVGHTAGAVLSRPA